MTKRVHNAWHYFTVSQGLRGCYMPDSCYEVRVKSRRELRDLLEYEARDIREAFDSGCSKRAVSWLANAAWKARKKAGMLPYVAEYGNRSGNGRVNYCFGLHVAPSTAEDFKTYQETEGL